MERVLSNLSASTSSASCSGTTPVVLRILQCQGHSKRACVAAVRAQTLERLSTRAPPVAPQQDSPHEHVLDQVIREGHFEVDLVDKQVRFARFCVSVVGIHHGMLPIRLTPAGLQAQKADDQQPTFASALPSFGAATHAEACVVGGGPAGLALAAELAKRHVDVVLVGDTLRPIATMHMLAPYISSR